MLVTKDPNASYKLIVRELEARGFRVAEGSLGRTSTMRVTAPSGKRWLTSVSRIAYPLIGAYSKLVCNNKDMAYELMRSSGVPIPFTKIITATENVSELDLRDAFDRFGSLAVKPNDNSLSRGLSLHIRDEKSLDRAVEGARRHSRGGNVVIQQQVTGEEIRFVYLEGEIVAALLRETPKLTGDGAHTVSELIKAENESRANIKSMVGYPQLDDSLIKIDISRSYIPKAGEVIELSRSTMISGGASVYNVIDRVHPDYLKIAKDAADALCADFVAVDMFVEDFTVPYTEGNAYLNEFNSSPVLKLFYSCRDGKNVDIVSMLVDAIEKRMNNE